MKYYTVGEFAELIGKNKQTLREWDKRNVLKPHNTAPTGYRYYSQEQLNHYLGFSCRLQGKRANKAKKMIKELLEDDNINQD